MEITSIAPPKPAVPARERTEKSYETTTTQDSAADRSPAENRVVRVESQDGREGSRRASVTNPQPISSETQAALFALVSEA